MEYVHGATLREWLKQGTRTKKEIVGVFVQAGRGLEAAHAEGILHRDFKPDNVLVDDRGRARVLDFGLARLDESPVSAGTHLVSSSGVSSRDIAPSLELEDTGVNHRNALATPLTRAGSIMGTPAYMAPEQLSGLKADARTDQFAFCVALYEALSGERPFGGATIAELTGNIFGARFKSPAATSRISRAVRRHLVRGLGGRPEDRFPSMSDLLVALERAVAARRERAILGVVAVLATVSAVVVATRPPQVRPCRGASEEIATTWGAEQARAVEHAFAASGSPRASEAFAHTRPALDRYAESWVAMHTEACEATRVRGEQSDDALDLRMSCLKQRQRELAATVDLFAKADAKLVDDAPLIAAKLTPVDSCADGAALRAPFARQKDEAGRRAADLIGEQLASARALSNAGRFSEAYAAVRPAVDEAQKLDGSSLHAEAILAQGIIEVAMEKPEATRTFEDAAIEATSVGDDVTAIEGWTRAMGRAANFDHAEAARYARITEAFIHRVHGTDAMHAELLINESWDAYKRGSASEALRLAREAMTFADRSGKTWDVLNARAAVADALWDQGELEESSKIAEAEYATERTLFGDTNPSTLRTRCDIGEAQTQLGEYAAAVATLEPIVQGGSERVTILGYARMLLGQAMIGAGRTADGIATFEEGTAIFREVKMDEEQIADDTADLARALVQRDEDTAAEAYAARALAGMQGSDGRPEERAEAYGVRALCRVRRGDAKGALADAEVALGTKERLFGARGDLVPRLARGEALLRLGRPQEGLAELEKALAVANTTKGDLPIRAEVRFAVSRAIEATRGDIKRAMELATRAADELDGAGMAQGAARVRGWMATAQR